MDELNRIAPEFQEAFRRFIETGETDDAFLKHMDTDETCQKAVDAALREQAKEVRAFAEMLRNLDSDPREPRPKPSRLDDILEEIESVATGVGSANETEIEKALERHRAQLPAIADGLDKFLRVAKRLLQDQDHPNEVNA